MRRRLRLLLGALAILILPLAALRIPPVRDAFLAVIALMRGGTPAGVAVYLGAYSLGGIVTAPFALLSGMAGYAYGPVRGMLLALPANVLGATSAFLVGRFALSARIARRVDHLPQWHALQHAVGESPFRIAVLLRLTPLAPQNLFSYALSLTRMPLRTFMLATWLGVMPITCFHVYVGSLVRDASELLDGKRPPMGVWGWAATALGLAMTVGGIALMARLARRALAKSGVVLGAGAP
jgi:uncharacterized membrane protein YdjX (TVP38/TMEM64 family)